MITLGITGRSGCGKSTVAALLAGKGVPVADADKIARDILAPGSPLLPRLAATFGADILDENGVLNRRLLADRAFAAAEGKAALDSLTHPEIVRRIRAAKSAAEKAGSPLFVIDGAAIVGTAAEAECDRLMVVTVPFEVSLERIMARDGISAGQAGRRLNAQQPEAELLAKADYVINGAEARAEVERKVLLCCKDALHKAGCDDFDLEAKGGSK